MIRTVPRGMILAIGLLFVAGIAQAQQYAQITYDGHGSKTHTRRGSPGSAAGTLVR